MAIFNPQVPNADDKMPNYFKFSDSISQPKADESGAYKGTADAYSSASKAAVITTVGKGIEGAAALGDNIVKEVIKSDVYQRVDAERDKFTTALYNANTYGDASGPRAPAGNDPANTVVEGTPGPPVDLMSGGKTSVPTVISKGISDIARTQAGLDQNKVTKTEYIKNINTIAKDLRSTYAPYRDYIDTEIAKVTGMNPANALMDQYVENINNAMGSARKEQDYWRNKIVDSGYPDSAEMLAKFEKTGDHNQVARYLAFNNGVRSTLQLKKLAAEDKNQDEATRLKSATDYANSAANHAATTFFYNSTKFVNGDQSPADIADKMADLSLHPEKANDAAYQGLSERYLALHTQAYNQTMRILTTPQKGQDGKMVPPMSDTLGMAETKKIVDNSVGALFQQTRDFISDKQFGPAFHLQNAGAATVNNQYFSILTDPTLKGKVATAAALNKAAPNFAPFMTGKFMGDGLDTELGTFTTEQGRQAVAQTGGKYYGVDGKIYSFRQSIEEQERASEISGQPIPGQAIKNLTKVREVITDPQATPEAISNTVKYYFDPVVNKGVMKKLMDDYYDPAKGSIVKGRSSAFATLTDPELTKAIYTKGAPTDWQKYSTWAKGEFAEQFGSGVRDLNVKIKEGNPNLGNPESMMHTSWNSNTKQFEIKRNDGQPLNVAQNFTYGTMVSNLNMGLKNMAEIAKTEGTNVDAYLFKVLKDNGFRPDKDIDGVPAQVMRALITGNGGKVKDAPSSPVQRFAPEDVRGDLSSFLTNPAGSQGQQTTSQDGPHQRRGVIKGNLSDEQLIGIQTDEIPEGMSARDFIKMLKAGKKLGGSVQ